MVILARSYRMLSQTIGLEAKLQVNVMLQERFNQVKPEWSMPLSYRAAPIMSRPKRVTEEAPLPQLDESDDPETSLNPDDPDNKKSGDTDTDSQGAADSIEPDMDSLAPEVAQKAGKVNIRMSLVREFERELEEFIETLEEDPAAPSPEKW